MRRFAFLRSVFVLVTLSVGSIGCLALDDAADDPPENGDEDGDDEAALAASGATPTWSHVEIGGGARVALALDGAGNPALSYERGAPQADLFGGGDTTVVYAANNGQWRTGSGWTTGD